MPYQVFIGQPEEFPVVRERGVILEPGLEHFVDISSYSATTDKSAEALDVKYRGVFLAPTGTGAQGVTIFVCSFVHFVQVCLELSRAFRE